MTETWEELDEKGELAGEDLDDMDGLDLDIDDEEDERKPRQRKRRR